MKMELLINNTVARTWNLHQEVRNPDETWEQRAEAMIRYTEAMAKMIREEYSDLIRQMGDKVEIRVVLGSNVCKYVPLY